MDGLGLCRRDIDHEPVQCLGKHYLAAEAAVLAPILNPEVEQVILHVSGPPDSIGEFRPHPDVTRRARAVAAALADDPGHAVTDRGGHDGLAGRRVHRALNPVRSHVHNLGQPCLLKWSYQYTISEGMSNST